MVFSSAIKAKSLWDLPRTVLNILHDEQVQSICKTWPLFIAKGTDGYDLYLGYDSGEIHALFYFFAWSETEKYPSSSRFLLSADTVPLDQYVDQLKDEFGIHSPEILEELVTKALAPHTANVQAQTKEALIHSTSYYPELSKILLDSKIVQACKKGIILIKNGGDGRNLYFGEAYADQDHKEVCFFESEETHKEDKKIRHMIISISQWYHFAKTILERYGISTGEELRKLVSQAVSPRSTEQVQTTKGLLDSALQ